MHDDDDNEDLDAAILKYEEFHRYGHKRIIVGRGFEMPGTMYRAGKALWVTYRSPKVDPETLRKPRSPVNYIHEHDAGVSTYLPTSADADGGPAVDVPAKFRDATALTRLGINLGFSYEMPDGFKQEMRATRKGGYPELYATPDGNCLIVIEARTKVIAMMWGGGLGVYPRGIDG